MMTTTNLRRLMARGSLIVLFLAGFVHASQETVGPARASISEIKISFKMDPRVTRGMYMGDRWISPPTYTRIGEGPECTLEVRAEVLDAEGKPIGISPAWTPSDPEMVGVTPAQGNEVKITVKQAGESSLKVTFQGFSKTLLIKAAAYHGNALQVDITPQ